VLVANNSIHAIGEAPGFYLPWIPLILLVGSILILSHSFS